MDPADFKAVYQAVQKLGDDPFVRAALHELDSAQIYHTYYEQLKKRPGESAQIRRELAERFNRSEKAIQYVLYRQS